MLVIVPEGKEREKGAKKKILEIIEAGKFPSLVNYTDARSSETPNRKNTTNTKPTHVIGKLHKTKDGEKTLKGIRHRGNAMCLAKSEETRMAGVE